MRVMLLEDDPLQLELAGSWLRGEGHAVSGFTQGKEAMKAMRHGSFDLVILDWMVPDVSGEELLQWIRTQHKRLPVIFATAKDEEAEIASILQRGADDYIVKPLRRLEFIARVNAVARRAGLVDDGSTESLEIGPYRLEPTTRSIRLKGKPVKMTPRMVDVALVLFRKRGELVSRAQLYEQIWGHTESLDTRSVDTHVSRLRQALELDGRHGWRLSSVYQHGYRLEPVAPG